MPENTTIVEQKQGEPVVTTAEVKTDPFAILETEPIFTTEDKGSTAKTVDLNLTLTPEELAAKKTADDAKIAEEATALVNKAKELGLAETATKEEITAAETKIADDLKAKKIELGLPETATKEEITAAELKKAESQGFTTEDELKTGLLGAKDGTWKAMMLAKGYEIPEDFNKDWNDKVDEEKGFEVFTQLEEAKWKAEIEKAKTEAQESVLTTLKPELRAAIELANAMPDMTLEQILSPTLQIDNYLKLDKEELIRAEIVASNPKYTPEMVDIEMQKIKDGNQIDIIDSKIRIDLQSQREGIKNLHTQRIQEYQNRQLQEKTAAEKGKIEQVIKALDRVPTFLDKNITHTDRQFIANKINGGLITDLVNNPEKLAKAAIMLEFYDKGITSYENRVREKLLLEHKKTLHNTPVTTTGGGANTTVVTKPIENQFDILKADFGEK